MNVTGMRSTGDPPVGGSPRRWSMLPSPIGFGIAAGALAGVILGVRLLLRPTAGSPDVVSWTILPGLVRGIRAWVRPRPPALPASVGGARPGDGEPLDVPPDLAAGEVDEEAGLVADEIDDVADPVPTIEVRHQEVGVHH
jgi:hypothetical protein